MSSDLARVSHPTIFHFLAAQLRKVLPSDAVRQLRGIASAAVTPLLWTKKSGHWKTCLKGRAIDSKGNPTIWFTYPAIEFLESIDFTKRRVLELGAGNSTLWWGNRAAEVISLEGNAEWFSYLNGKVAANVSLYLGKEIVPPEPSSVALCASNAPYDVIAIDGFDRYGFSLLAQDWLTNDGIVIFDNSEGTWGGDHDGSHPFIDHFNSIGFQRVDFYGYCPNGSLPSCTSIFFRDRAFVFTQLPAPLRK